MSAPVLSISEQKEAISGKKKKKKTMKNVLGIPANLKVECQVVEEHETEKLNKILERLFTAARLPVQPNAKAKKDSSKEIINENELTEIKKKRNQLSLGVNALSRNIKNELISAALLASDIQPRFLVHHLNLLCSHNKIPFLHLPGLRNVTKNSLGFPCIAVGFKKNYSDFSEAVDEIKTISQNKKIVTDDDAEQESSVESSSEESEEEICNENSTQSRATPFTYLLRRTNKERVFVPEKCRTDETKPDTDVIMLDKDDSEVKIKVNQLGISSNLIRKRKSELTKIDMKSTTISQDVDDEDDEEYEDLEVPKKKAKKDWVIDKVGSQQNYYGANLMRVPSNPNRKRRE